MSGDASFNLFNWHRNYEGGLWLIEGSEDIDAVRTTSSHPWIRDDSNEDAGSESGSRATNQRGYQVRMT